MCKHLLNDVQYLNNFVYPTSYLWAYWDGWGYVVDVVINNAIQARFSLKDVPELFKPLPVIKNLDYIETPEWANVVYVENLSKTAKKQNQKRQMDLPFVR